MVPYLFVIEVKPKPDNPQGKDIAGANAHIWVFDQSINAARTKALRHVESHGWDVLKVANEFQPSPEQISELGEPEHANYRQAELNGVSLDLLAWPKVEKPEEKVAYVQPLKKPPKDK